MDARAIQRGMLPVKGDRMITMEQKKQDLKMDTTYQKGQSILYKGDAAEILFVKPVLTIKITNKSHVVCGNALLKDICVAN